MEYQIPERKRRYPELLNYIIVGIVGAVIGGLLVVAVVPQVLIHRMEKSGTLVFTNYQAGSTLLGSSSDSSQAADGQPVDPWQYVVAAAEKVSPAVVGIVNKSVAGVDFFGRQYMRQTSGSGLIISPDGYIVTNNHVIDKARDISVYLADGSVKKAQLVGADPATDLAVIKVDGTNLPTATFGDSDKLKPGQLAIAIGNPLGMDFKRTVTVGVVSGLERVLQVGDFSLRLIQTDAVINPGNSGGPLVNGRGEVIGLNSAKISSEAVEGMGFAIPSNLVKRIANEIISTGKVRRAQVGVRLADRDTAQAYLPDVKFDRGLYVVEVIAGGPAARAGMRSGDIILEFNGVAVNDFGTFQALLMEKVPGQTVTFKVLRGGQELRIDVVLGEAKS